LKIVIVGNGKVGSYLTERLLDDKHQVTLVDSSEAALKEAEALDIMRVEGSGSSLSVLRQAKVENCDILIAVTGSDEVNMLCCFLGKRIGARYTIARVRDTIYNDDIRTIKQELALDMTINPEFVTARELVRLVRFPQACEIETFHGGKIEMASLRVEEDDFIAGQTVLDIMKKLRNTSILFCVVERGNETYIPNGSFKILRNDKLHIIGSTPSLVQFFSSLGRISTKVSDVMVIGGGRIAYYLCRSLDKLGIRTKIIEQKEQKCRILSSELDKTIIINGDGTDRETLMGENLTGMDVFVSLTNRDEDNLITSLYAMQCGVPKVIAKNNRIHYSSVIQQLGLEGIISPKVITGNHILQFVRGLDNSEGSEMLNLYQIADGRAEVLEFHINDEAPYNGVKLKDVPTHDNVLIAAIIRKGQVIIPGGESCMLAGDNVVIVTAGLNVKQFDEIFRR